MIVLDDDGKDQPRNSEVVFERMLESARLASSIKLFDVAYVYLIAVLGRTAQEIARRHGVRNRYRTNQALLEDLGFKGVVPQEVVEASLAAISIRNSVAHATGDETDISEQSVQALVRLCERLRHFV